MGIVNFPALRRAAKAAECKALKTFSKFSKKHVDCEAEVGLESHFAADTRVSAGPVGRLFDK